MSLETLPLEKIFYHRCGLMMYKYYNNFLPCTISQLYAKNDSIHGHNNNNNNNNNNNIYLKSNIHSIIRYKFSGLYMYNGIKHGIHIKTVQCI